MRYGIAVFPTKEVQDFANNYRKRYDPHYTLIQPHLTIREPEEWDEERLQQAVEQLEKAAVDIAPFNVKLNRFSSFHPASNVIYLALEDTEAIGRCYEAICQGVLSEPNRSFLYNPHLTIGQELGDEEFHDVLASVRKVPVNLTFKADRVHMLYQTENMAWTAYQTFQFRG